MNETVNTGKSIRWKLVGVGILTFLLFYILPIYVVKEFVGGMTAIYVTGGWILGGALLLGGVLGYFLKGVTQWEPAIASGVTTCVSVVLTYIFHYPAGLLTWSGLADVGGSTAVMFLLALIGAWYGLRVKNSLKSSPPLPSPE